MTSAIFLGRKVPLGIPNRSSGDASKEIVTTVSAATIGTMTTGRPIGRVFPSTPSAFTMNPARRIAAHGRSVMERIHSLSFVPDQ